MPKSQSHLQRNSGKQHSFWLFSSPLTFGFWWHFSMFTLLCSSLLVNGDCFTALSCPLSPVEPPGNGRILTAVLQHVTNWSQILIKSSSKTSLLTTKSQHQLCLNFHPVFIFLRHQLYTACLREMSIWVPINAARAGLA